MTQRDIADLRQALADLLAEARAEEDAWAEQLEALDDRAHSSGCNLVHYLALRRHDLRPLQDRLTVLGLSSLGRAESGVVPAIEAVLGLLDAMQDCRPLEQESRVDVERARGTLELHTRWLLGEPPPDRPTRLMVTMPSEAGRDPSLVRRLLQAGMDVMRINCAHDEPELWSQMIENLRLARSEVGRNARVQFDLPGPKLRTGASSSGVTVRRFKPVRDEIGRVVRPASFVVGPDPNQADVPLSRALVDALEIGDELVLRDARGRRRSWRVEELDGARRRVSSENTTYVVPGLMIEARRNSLVLQSARVGALVGDELPLRLGVGDRILVCRSERVPEGTTELAIGCLEPDALAEVHPGDPILFDDGKIRGIVAQTTPQALEVEITGCPPGGAKLRSDKGINLPGSDLRLPFLGTRELELLDFVVPRADLLGLSFVREPSEVARARAEAVKRGRPDLGLVLKIETRQAFEALPRLLMEALAQLPAGVMVARGDLGVELGFERLAEVQEEILWLCEAAHVPVIWATQVLDTMARTGLPSRAEVTDAAMSSRAECVMLNKGPYVAEALVFLIDVMRRMQAHQNKKRSLLRRLSITSR